jgi:hypothetical protein
MVVKGKSFCRYSTNVSLSVKGIAVLALECTGASVECSHFAEKKKCYVFRKEMLTVKSVLEKCDDSVRCAVRARMCKLFFNRPKTLDSADLHQKCINLPDFNRPTLGKVLLEIEFHFMKKEINRDFHGDLNFRSVQQYRDEKGKIFIFVKHGEIKVIPHQKFVQAYQWA